MHAGGMIVPESVPGRKARGLDHGRGDLCAGDLRALGAGAHGQGSEAVLDSRTWRFTPDADAVTRSEAFGTEPSPATAREFSYAPPDSRACRPADGPQPGRNPDRWRVVDAPSARGSARRLAGSALPAASIPGGRTKR